MGVATFRGRHNQSKSKAFIVLYHRLLVKGITEGLGVRELSALAGIDYNYLKSRIGTWAKLGYISRRMTYSAESARPIFVYSLLKKGIRYIEVVIPRDRLNDYIIEIRASKVSINTL